VLGYCEQGPTRSRELVSQEGLCSTELVRVEKIDCYISLCHVYSFDSHAEGKTQISNRVRTEFFGLSVLAITYKQEDCAGIYMFRRILRTGGN
jgi:hypothetical protein